MQWGRGLCLRVGALHCVGLLCVCLMPGLGVCIAFLPSSYSARVDVSLVDSTLRLSCCGRTKVSLVPDADVNVQAVPREFSHRVT